MILGGRTVEELMTAMSAAEFSEWIAYYSIEPLPWVRDDLGRGVIASTVANVHRRRGSAAKKAQDYAPFLKRLFGIRLTDVEAIKQRVKAYVEKFKRAYPSEPERSTDSEREPV